MRELMQISVIIPVYNTAEYLCGCVDSVLANDCADCELLLVDDGATDGICPGLCDDYGKKYPDFVQVIHQQNKGLGGARNTGIEAAKGEYLLFVDSDDTLAPQTLSVLKEQIRKTHADIYSFHLYSHDGQGTQKKIEIAPDRSGVFTLAENPEHLFSLPAAWARLWRKDLFLSTAVRFPERVWYEDIRTTAKLLAAAASIVMLPDALYYYLARPGSIMRSGNTKRSMEILEAFEDILQWYEAHGLRQNYEDQLCRLAVDHIQLAATVRIAREDPGSPYLKELSDYMQSRFPKWRENPYLSELPKKHKFLLRLIDHRSYRLVRWIFCLKG